MLPSDVFFQPIDDSNRWPYWLIGIFDSSKQGKGIRFLERYGAPRWCPTMPRPELKHGRPGEVKRSKVLRDVPMLRNYVLIPAPFFDSAVVQNAPGFHRFMIVNESLALVRNDELEPLRNLEKMLNDPNYVADDGRPKYKRGDLVKMIDGVWAGIIAKVESVDRSGMIRLDGCKLGRLKVRAEQIEPATTP